VCVCADSLGYVRKIYFLKIRNDVNNFFKILVNFALNILVNSIYNQVHVNSIHCGSPFFYIVLFYIEYELF